MPRWSLSARTPETLWRHQSFGGWNESFGRENRRLMASGGSPQPGEIQGANRFPNVLPVPVDYAHWNELHSSVGIRTPSPMDGDVADEEVTARREYKSRILAEELAIEIDIAAALVNAVPPTGRFWNAPSECDVSGGEDDLKQGGPRYW